MSLKKSDKFKREAVQLALTSGLSRKQVAADLGIGMSTLNKWVAKHKHDDLMSGPHDDLHKELARLGRENRILKEERAEHPLHLLCKAFNVSLSGYYDWRKRPMSQRQRDDLILLTNIRTIHNETYQSYGRERMTDELRDLGFTVSEKRVARLMKDNNIKVIRTPAFKKTTDSDHNFNVAPNLLDGDFTTTGPNQKWAGDISYIRTTEGWLYLAVVIDLYSRRVIGWATSKRLKRKLVMDALQRAVALRQPPEDMIFHSDRGSQYCSHDYQKLLNKHGFKASMSGKGNCYDNAVVETFFKSLKAELIWRMKLQTREQAEKALFGYINRFSPASRDDDNPKRRPPKRRRCSCLIVFQSFDMMKDAL